MGHWGHGKMRQDRMFHGKIARIDLTLPFEQWLRHGSRTPAAAVEPYGSGTARGRRRVGRIPHADAPIGISAIRIHTHGKLRVESANILSPAREAGGRQRTMPHRRQAAHPDAEKEKERRGFSSSLFIPRPDIPHSRFSLSRSMTDPERPAARRLRLILAIRVAPRGAFASNGSAAPEPGKEP